MSVKNMTLVILLAMPLPASAANIVIGNDDGLTSNVRALYEALKAEGHDVIVSVPCRNQSGMGSAVRLEDDGHNLSSDCRNGAARAGGPAAGPMTRPGLGPDFFYVAGTPLTALIYGLDVEATRRWGRLPDLVLSGPNEGQNGGPLLISSGTVSNAQYAILRGIPAIALSGSANLVGDDGLDNPGSAKVATLVVGLLQRLWGVAKSNGLLPQGTALNVNFPDDLTDPKWQAARIGTYNGYKISVVVSQSGDGPRLSAAINTDAPVKGQENDEAVIHKSRISVSVMQAGYEQHGAAPSWLRRALERN